jgi:hypothetical protein
MTSAATSDGPHWLRPNYIATRNIWEVASWITISGTEISIYSASELSASVDVSVL